MASPLQKFRPSKDLAKRSAEKYLEEALYIRLFKDGGSEKSVRLQLNKFIKSHKRVFKWEVGDTLRKLRDRKLYYPALKVRLTKHLKFCCILLLLAMRSTRLTCGSVYLLGIQLV